MEDNDIFTLDGVSGSLEVVSYSEAGGKSVVTLKAPEALESETVYNLIVDGNKIQIGQGNETSLDVYTETYTTSDVDAPELIMDGDDVADYAYVPTKGMVAVKDGVLGLVFDEEVVGAGSIEIHRWDGTLVATIDVTGIESDDIEEGAWEIELVDISDEMEANPSFISAENYYVIVPAGAITDVAGNPFAGITTINEWAFELQDANNPLVTFVQNEMSNVPVDTKIDLIFDRKVVLNPGEEGWLAIYMDGAKDAIQLIRINNDVEAVDPTKAYSFIIDELMPNTKYFVELGKASFVLAADSETPQAQVEIGEWWFTTEVDEAPKAITYQPAKDEVVLPMTDLVITFDQNVVAGTGNIQLHNYKSVGDNIISTFNVTDASKVIFDGMTLTIPAEVLGLQENSKYYVIIPATAVRNNTSSPEYWEGVVTPLEWSFSTVEDGTVPELISWTPQDTIADNHPTFVMTFSENVELTTAGGMLKVYPKDSTVAVITVPLTAAMINGNVVTVDYDATIHGSLDKDATYYVLVDGGALADATGNEFAGVSNVTAWVFTTGTDFKTVIEDIVTVNFKVYPNPFNDRIMIDNNDKLTRVIVSNIAGQRVLDIEYPGHEIRTANLVSGVYIISLFTEDGRAKTERMIKR